MKAIIATALLLALVGGTASAQSPAALDFKQSLEKKTLFVRGFPAEKTIVYDATGSPASPLQPGSWTYGQIYVEKVELADARIVIIGKRVGQEYDHRWKERRTTQTQQLEIQVAPQDLTASQAQSIMRAIFIPEHDVKKDVTTDWVRVNPHSAQTNDANKVYSIGGGVKPPMPLLDGEDEATVVREPGAPQFKGTALVQAVVNEKGEVVSIRLRKPLGMGLDEKALAGVQRWRFQPALKDGVPVSVVINVEVNFNLH